MSGLKAEWKVIVNEQEKLTSKEIVALPEVKQSKLPVVVIITDGNEQEFNKVIEELKINDVKKFTFIHVKGKQEAPYKAMVFNRGKLLGKTINLDEKGIATLTNALKSIVK